MDQDRGSGVALQHPLEFGDMVVVVVGEEHVRESEAHPLEHGEQWGDGTPRVDHHRVLTKLVGHQIRVGQEIVVHRALDDHRREPILSDEMTLIHTCYRILEIERSVAFYEALGFQEMRRAPIRDEAINVFMGLPEDGGEPRLELTYNIGRHEPYELGNCHG